MKVSDVRAYYRDQSEKGSSVARQLALAGIAVVWMFRTDGETLALPWILYLAAAAFIASLGADMAQYLLGTRAWFEEARKTAQLGPDEDHKVAATTNMPLQVLHSTKLVAAGLGGALLVAFLVVGAVTSGPTKSQPPVPCVCQCGGKS